MSVENTKMEKKITRRARLKQKPGMIKMLIKKRAVSLLELFSLIGIIQIKKKRVKRSLHTGATLTEMKIKEYMLRKARSWVSLEKMAKKMAKLFKSK